MEASALYVLDQGRFPFESVEIECQSGAEASRAIREMAVRGAPAIAQVAAFGLALTAERTRDAKPYVRLATLRGTANSLVGARQAPAALRGAVDRMLARMTAVGELVEDGGPIADALRAEADAIAMEATLDHARLVEAGRVELEALVRAAERDVAREPLAADAVTPAERPLGVLTLGSTGALSGGQIGTALGVAIACHRAGRPVHVHVLESRPGLEGARLAAWELAQAGVPHTVLADAAAGWLLSRGGIDAILLGADRIAADGSVLGPLGTLPVALAGASARIPVLVCAPWTAIDASAEDLSDLPDETRPPIELMRVRGVDVSAPGTPWLDPVVDVTPAEVVSAFVTEAGVIRPPFAPALADLAASVAARRPQPGPAGRDALSGPAATTSGPGAGAPGSAQGDAGAEAAG
jgi:methylthioribose-1-phosphate isomerase